MAGPEYQQKMIADPVHGTIGLSTFEREILDTAAVQRLRNVKQLGLAHYVYPGADFSRFPHSVGVLHVTGKFLSALEATGQKIQKKVYRACRIAALVHDIGHYPFSHTWEQVAENHYKSQVLEPKHESDVVGEATLNSDLFWKHERVAKELLLHDPELKRLLEKAKIEAAELASFFNREQPGPLANLVSSDLDADRVDYLLRTALHTGLPYGAVDLPYLITQLRLDNDGAVCLDPRALRTADHLILCRFFDRQQVAHHKTATAFELLLKDVIKDLLRLPDSPVATSPTDVTKLIKNGRWYEFTDSFVMAQIADLARETKDDLVRLKANAVLRRQPPKLLVEMERFASRDADQRRTFRLEVKEVKRQLKVLEDEPDLAGRLFLWDPPPMPLTKIGALVPVVPDEQEDDDSADAYEQSIRILDRRKGTSRPITSCNNSLLKVLGEQSFYSLRVYGIFDDTADSSRRHELHRRIKKAVPDVAWT